MDARGKDCSTSQTINRIKGILETLGLTTEEKILDSKVGVYSVNLKVFCDGTAIGFCNGKGITVDYAMASAYAECMERLSAFDMSDMYKYAKFPISSLAKYDTILYPDEKYMPIDMFCTQKDSLSKHFLSFFPHEENLKKALAVLNPINNNSVKVVPYKSVLSDDDETVYFPVAGMQLIHGSTGLCAGNNYKEAVCQGIFELMERYCQQEIIRGKISPPNIPDEYLQQFPEVWESVKKIRSNPNKEFYIKDCSLGQGFPVVASVLIDRTEHSYIVNFGSSFQKNIAIERVITEIMQGYTIDEYNRIFFVPRLYSNVDDIINKNFIDGIAEYPVEFFNGIINENFKGEHFISVPDNEIMYTYVTEFLKKKGYSLYVRDNSFLAFNCYNVVIPEIMPNIIVFNEKEVQLLILDHNLSKQNMRIDAMSINDIREYINAIEYAISYYSYLPMLNKNIKYFSFEESRLGQYEDIRMLLALFYDILGVYHEAYLYTNDFMVDHGLSLDKEIMEDLHFIRDYFNIKARGITEVGEIRNYLNKFYLDSTIDKFQGYFTQEKGLIKYFYGKNCGVNKPLISATTKYFDRVREVMIGNWKNGMEVNL